MNDHEGELTTREDAALQRSAVPTQTAETSPQVRNWLLIVGVVAVLFVVIQNTPGWGGQADTVAASGVASLAIDTRGTPVGIEIEAGRGNEITAELNGSAARRYQVRIERNGDQVSVAVTRFGWHLFSFGRAMLTVAVPGGDMTVLVANGSSGGIEVSDLSAGGAQLSTRSGGVRVEDSTFASNLTLSTSSGGVRIGELQVGGDLALNTSSGGVRIEDIRVGGDLALSTSSGGVRVQEAQVGGVLSANTSSGGITLEDAVAAGGYRLSASSGGINATGLPGSAVQATTSSGGIRLSAVAILDDWNLNASSGGVTVNLDRTPAALRIDFRGNSGGWTVANNLGLSTSETSGNRLLGSVGQGGPLLTVRTSSGRFQLN